MTETEFSLRLFLESVSPEILKRLLNELELPDIAALFDEKVDENVPDAERRSKLYGTLIERITDIAQEKRDKIIQIFYSIQMATRTEIDEMRIAEYVAKNIPEVEQAKPAGMDYLRPHDYAALVWIIDEHGDGRYWQNIQWHVFDTAMQAKVKKYRVPNEGIVYDNAESNAALKADVEKYISAQQRQPVHVKFEISYFEQEKIRYTIYFSRDGQTHMEFDKEWNLVPREDKGAGIISVVYLKEANLLSIKDAGGGRRKNHIADSFAKHILGSRVEKAKELNGDLVKAACLGLNPVVGGVPYVESARVRYVGVVVDEGILRFDNNTLDDIVDTMRNRFQIDLHNIPVCEVWIDVTFNRDVKLRSQVKTIKLLKPRYDVNSKNKKVKKAVDELVLDVWEIY